MNKLVLFVSLMLTFCSSFGQVYKWTDSQGVVHFSDKPHEGAVKLKIQDTQTFKPPVSQTGGEPTNKEEESTQGEDHKYTKIEIVQPTNEATIRNNQGFVVVAVHLEPDLSPGDNLQMVFDGAPLGDPQPNLLFQLNGIYRGTHTMAVQVLNANGDVLGTSDPITIYMHRPRVGMVKGTGGRNEGN